MLFRCEWLAIGQLLVEHLETCLGRLTTALAALDDALAQRLVICLEADHQHRQATGFCFMTQAITLHLLQAGGIDADGDTRFQQRGGQMRESLVGRMGGLRRIDATIEPGLGIGIRHKAIQALALHITANTHAAQLTHLPRQVLIDVPFHAQDAFQCGPAALAMLFNHQLIPAEPDDLTQRVYIPGREGSLQIEMVAAAREQDLLVYPLKRNVEALLTELAAGNPVLVMQNLRFAWYPQWHYAVAIGYDLNRDALILHTGLDRAKTQSLTVFARTWERADRWARVLLRPTQLPATAEPLPYLKAAADLEQTGRLEAAEQAYRTALGQWPNEPTARFGLGNVKWAKGEREEAIGEFRSLLKAHPSFAPGWNNAIEAFDQMGCSHAAEAARRCYSSGQMRSACIIPCCH